MMDDDRNEGGDDDRQIEPEDRPPAAETDEPAALPVVDRRFGEHRQGPGHHRSRPTPWRARALESTGGEFAQRSGTPQTLSSTSMSVEVPTDRKSVVQG